MPWEQTWSLTVGVGQGQTTAVYKGYPEKKKGYAGGKRGLEEWAKETGGLGFMEAKERERLKDE